MRCASRGRRLLAGVVGLLIALGGPAALAVEAPQGLIGMHARAQGAIDWDTTLQQLSRANVVFLGEQHDDPATHRLELALLEALHAATRNRLVLSLEMFERDVQPVLDAYLQGAIPEAEFLAKSRPWPNYATDYRPLVEYAKANGIRVVASNVPRPLASKVAKEGLQGLDSLPPEQRRWAASQVEAPKDRLWERFKESIAAHPGVSEQQIERMYLAQSLKDATMAEAIAGVFTPDAPPTLVLHVNGAFHSDEGLGVPAQLARRRPELEQRVTTVVPVETPTVSPPEGVADVVFLVLRERV